jgi:lysophospholipase L1-like esterase
VDEEHSYALFKDIFKWATAKIAMLSEWYERIANELSLDYLDTSKSVKPSSWDGIHLDDAWNKIVAQELAKKIQEIV